MSLSTPERMPGAEASPAAAAPAPANVGSPPPIAQPVAVAAVVSPAHAVGPSVAAPVQMKSPTAVPVAATAPRLVPPTAAPIATAPVANSGGLFGTLARLQSKVETVAQRHAPGLVTAIREQVAAATMREEQERVEKAKHAERIIAAANAGTGSSSSSSSSSAAAPSVTSDVSVTHVPGLGMVALAASPPRTDEQKQARDAQVWSNLPKTEHVSPSTSAEAPRLEGVQESEQVQLAPGESELRRRKGAPAADDHASKSAAPPSPSTEVLSSSSRASPASSALMMPAASAGSPPVPAPAPVPAPLPASQQQAQTGFKLDLPLRLCLVILKKSAAEMRERYATYRATKASRREGDDPLSFAQFMFFSTIRTLPDFLFKKTELAYVMMRDEGDTLVYEENFVRYAPILAPLASKLDAMQVYLVLQQASIAAGAALTEEQVAAQEMENDMNSMEEQAAASSRSSSTADAHLPSELAAAAASSSAGSSSSSSAPRPPKLRAGGVGYAQFKTYVDALKRYTAKRGGDDSASGWPWAELSSTFPEVASAGPQEQLLVVRTGVTDTTHFPPRIGRIGLTTSFLLYESSFWKRTRAIRWNSITKIERNDEGFWRRKAHAAVNAVGGASSTDASTSRGMNIHIQEDEVVGPGTGLRGSEALTGGGADRGTKKRAEEVLTWDQPGWGEASIVERTRTFEYMQMMLTLHKLIRSLPDKVIASALVQETCMSMLRMRALESLGAGADVLLLNPFSEDNIAATKRAAAGASKAALSPAAPPLLASPASASSSSSSSSSSSITSSSSSSFVSAIAASIRHAEGIRKSKSSWLFAVLPGLQDRAKEKMEDDIDPEFAAVGHYKTAEELAVLARAVEQPFSLKNFAYNVKLLRHQLEPLMLFIAFVRRLRDWENPLATLATVILLLNMAYRDLLSYLPAMLVLLQIAIVATLKYYPHALQVALAAKEKDKGLNDGEGADERFVHVGAGGATVEELTDEESAFAGGLDGAGVPPGGAGSAESKERTEAAIVARGAATAAHVPVGVVVAGPGAGAGAALKPYHLPTAHPVPQAPALSPASAAALGAKSDDSSSSSSSSSSGGGGGGGLLSRIKNFRDVAVRTKEYLHSVQNQIGEHNVRMMKIEGLYKWRTPSATQRFFAMLCVIFVVLTFVPFRFIFPVLVLDFFTSKWQASSSWERLVDEVALPQHMPDMD